ncbi:MAG: 30S ribosomal protein S26e [Candidatus Bathyarchaeota archaeon]|nr:MAG: 30S ribosomal protein S26e [Candidatus Bathyarchaeota archaeon]
MPQKRKSRGRTKGHKGRSGMVQCDSCGSLVPRDKAKTVTRYSSLVDRTLAKELQDKGAFISRTRAEKHYCVSCAVHRRVVKVRAKNKRRSRR